MVPRSIVEQTIDKLALRHVSAHAGFMTPEQLADCYCKASKAIRAKLEAELLIDETK